MIDKVERWLKYETVPQRLLISGTDGAFDLALEIAAKLQGETTTRLLSGLSPDSLILRNEGTFKIGDSENPARDSVRGMIAWVNQKPVGHRRLVIIEDFERTGREANHALLKVLEEPPVKAQFLFTTRNHLQLLDTILSRMTVLRLPHNFEDFQIDEDVQKFLQSSDLLWKFQKIGEIDGEAKKAKDKKIILRFLDSLIVHARFFSTHQKFLEDLFEVQGLLSRNMNSKLVLEWLALKLTQS